MNSDEVIVQRARENAQRTLEQIRPAFAELQRAVGIIMQPAVVDAQRRAQTIADAIFRMPAIDLALSESLKGIGTFQKSIASQSMLSEVRALPIPKPSVSYTQYDAVLQEKEQIHQQLATAQKKIQKLRTEKQQLLDRMAEILRELGYDVPWELTLPYPPDTYDSYEDFDGISLDGPEPS